MLDLIKNKPYMHSNSPRPAVEDPELPTDDDFNDLVRCRTPFEYAGQTLLGCVKVGKRTEKKKEKEQFL